MEVNKFQLWREEDERESRQSAMVTAAAEDLDTDDDAEKDAFGHEPSVGASSKGKGQELVQIEVGSYHAKKNRHAHSAKHNPFGYHPQINQFGYHPEYNPQVRVTCTNYMWDQR